MTEPIKTSKVIVDGKEYWLPTGANLLGELIKLKREEYPGYGEYDPAAAEPPADQGYTKFGDWIPYPDQRDHGGHYVPHYCWHPGLSVSGNCRMCFVNITTSMKRGDEIVKNTMPGTACTNVVRDGMEIDTTSEGVRKVQNGVQEFLLINHPLDCPECDKSGECRLQDYAFDYSRGYSRFEETKVASHIKQLGPTIDFFGTRCIQCSRCIRFCDEVSETHELCFVNRGDRTTIDTFPGAPIDNRLDLNTVQLCPVGALKNHDFLYESRVWSMSENNSICNLCARGCSVRYDALKGVVKRVMAVENPNTNGHWVCNEVRHNYGWINRLDRLQQPISGGQEVTWAEAYVALSERLKSHFDTGEGSLAVVANCAQTVEELYLMKQVFVEQLRVSSIAAIARMDERPTPVFERFKESADRNPNRRGVELLLGVDDADASIGALVDQLRRDKVRTLFVVNNSWDGWLPPALLRDMDKAEYRVCLGLFNDQHASRFDLMLPTRTHAEKDGSFINEDWVLQSFRRAVDPVAGEDDAVLLQELLDRVRPQQGTGNVAVNLSAAALFSKVTEAIPQLAGYTHSSLRRAGGAKLM